MRSISRASSASVVVLPRARSSGLGVWLDNAGRGRERVADHGQSGAAGEVFETYAFVAGGRCGPCRRQGVRRASLCAAARSRSTSCSGAPATAIGVLLSASPRRRPPATARRHGPPHQIERAIGQPAGRAGAAEGGLDHPMGETPGRSRNYRQNRIDPAGLGSAFLPANRPLFSHLVRASHARGRRFETRRAHDMVMPACRCGPSGSRCTRCATPRR